MDLLKNKNPIPHIIIFLVVISIQLYLELKCKVYSLVNLPLKFLFFSGSLDGILPPHKNSMDQADNEKITLSQSVHNNYDYIANELNNLELLDEMINSDDNDDDDNNLKNNSNPTENIHKEKLRKTQKNKKKITKVLFGSSKQPFRALSRHAYLTCDIVSNGTRLCPHQQIPYKEILDRYEYDNLQ